VDVTDQSKPLLFGKKGHLRKITSRKNFACNCHSHADLSSVQILWIDRTWSAHL